MVLTQRGIDTSAHAKPQGMMAYMSDEAFWASFRYRPMREVDGVLADQMTEVFIDAFAAASLLTRPDRDAIEAQLELEVGSNGGSPGHRGWIQVRRCSARWR